MKLEIGDRVQGLYLGIKESAPFVGRITKINEWARIGSSVVTVELEKPLHVDDVILNRVHEQYRRLELVC